MAQSNFAGYYILGDREIEVIGVESDCVFCQIVAGESPASVFYADDIVLGLMTIGPVTTGHAMIIPKQHISCLADLDEKTGLKTPPLHPA